MPKVSRGPTVNELPLARALEQEVSSWSDQGWSGATPTTHELLNYWFSQSEDEGGERFHECQRRAIETVIYCHEILQLDTPMDAYVRLAGEALASSAGLLEEVSKIPFPKYALKMATGTGKTWVLAALLVWQYFNAINGENSKRYSKHFMVVAPGHEVLYRLLDMFLGKHNPKTGLRDESRSDFSRDLFMDRGPRWRDRFNWAVLQPSDVRANMTPPDGAFVYITNWQQFKLSRAKPNLWDGYTGADTESQPRGEVIANFLADYPDLIVLNDEAHHVHGSKRKDGEELVWRRFMEVLYERIAETHKEEQGLFLQIDFSATPFFGSGERKEMFPHIVYDYDLIEAMRSMLVKQIFLEERQSVPGEDLRELRVSAERAEPDSDHHRGEILGLSEEQRVLLQIGRLKLEQIAREFTKRGIEKKPVMFVIAESTEVADMISEHLSPLMDERRRYYRDQTLVIHSNMKGDMTDKEWQKHRLNLETLDEPEDINPFRVVISVLMLREGFDTKNVVVTVVLRSAEADLLLEQVVGRGLRLMFPPYEHPELHDMKREARDDLMKRRTPNNSLDFLFVVEHPRFKQFYEDLREEGYPVGIGDSSEGYTAGDLLVVEATPDRVERYDVLWPLQVYDDAPPLDVGGLDVNRLPIYSKIRFEDIQTVCRDLFISDTNFETGTKHGTWKMSNDYFDYNYFLSQSTRIAATQKGKQALTASMSDITDIIDTYVTNRLFDREIDFSKQENYAVLNYADLFNFITDNVRLALVETIGEIQYEVRPGRTGRASDIKKLFVREKSAIPTERCIYPMLGSKKTGEGFEKMFITEILNLSSEVEAFIKIQERKHDLNISYRDIHGITRPYYPDFIVKTAERMFIVETKAAVELQKAEGDPKSVIVLKARAARSWCNTASKVRIKDQPMQWEYIIVSDGDTDGNWQIGFSGLVSLARLTTKRLLNMSKGRLM